MKEEKEPLADVLTLAEAGHSVRHIVKKTGHNKVRVKKIKAALSEALATMSRAKRGELRSTAKRKVKQ